MSVTYKQTCTIFLTTTKNLWTLQIQHARPLYTHLDNVSFLKTDLVCFRCHEREQSHRLHDEQRSRVRKLSQYDWRERESGSVTGAQQCGITLLRHERISAWRQSLTSRSLVNEERFLCACVCPCSSMWLSWRVCEHVDEAAALSISAIYTFLNSGALVKHFHEGNQWQRKEGRKTRREGVKTSQRKVWWSGTVFTRKR